MLMDLVSKFEQRVMMEAEAGAGPELKLDTKHGTYDDDKSASSSGILKETLSRATVAKYGTTSAGKFLKRFDISHPNYSKGFIYTDNGKVCGAVQVNRLKDGKWWIDELELSSWYNDKGLYGRMIRDAKSLGATDAKVSKNNNDLVHEYLVAGFKCYKDDGITYMMSTKGGNINISDPKPKLKKPGITQESYDAFRYWYNFYNESVDISSGDTYINMQNFESGLFNFILVVGLPGSGKGTIGKEMVKKYNAQHIELDVFDQAGNMSKIDIMKAGPIFSEYLFGTEAGRWYFDNNDTLSINERMRANHDFILYVIDYAKSHKHAKFVIDGTSIYACMEPEEIKNYPIVIKGTSAVESFRNKVKRDAGTSTDDNPLHSRVSPEHIKGLLQYYWSDAQCLQDFKDEVEDNANEDQSIEVEDEEDPEIEVIV